MPKILMIDNQDKDEFFNPLEEKFFYPGRDHVCERRINANGTTTKKAEISSSIRNDAVGTNNSNEHKISHRKHTSRHRSMGINRNLIRLTSASLVLVLFTLTVAFFSGVFGEEQRNSKFMEYDNFIWPVVMQDPPPFSKENPPPKELILDASIWMAASAKKNIHEGFDPKGKVIISEDEVVAACNSLFNLPIDIKSIDCSKKFYEYNIEKHQFYVDSVSYDQCYIPNTINMVDFGDSIILKVGYIKLDAGYESYDHMNVDKYMDYVLQANPINGEFYISEIRNSK